MRTSETSAVLHDLTSCLISADAKPVVEQEVHVKTQSGSLHAALVSLYYEGEIKRALLWFQKGYETAPNRWTWRLISTTSPTVRDAAAYYQVEVAVKSSGDRNIDLVVLKQLSGSIFDDLAKN